MSAASAPAPRMVGLIGMLIIDRDAEYVRDVLTRVDAAIGAIHSASGNSVAVDMVVEYTGGVTSTGGHTRGALDAICMQRNAIRAIALDTHPVPSAAALTGVSTIIHASAKPTEPASAAATPTAIAGVVTSLAGNGAAAVSASTSTATATAAANTTAGAAATGATFQYEWLFFLDSDIGLNENTLLDLLLTRQPLIGAVYAPRWASAQHTAIGVLVGGDSDGGGDDASDADELKRAETEFQSRHHARAECAIQLLIDAQLLRPCEECTATAGANDSAPAKHSAQSKRPHLGFGYCRPPPNAPPVPSAAATTVPTAADAKSVAVDSAKAPLPPASFECAILGMGATLLHRSALLRWAFRVSEVIGGVEGEDIGFCIDCLTDPTNRRHSQSQARIRPRFLAGHVVPHFGAAKTSHPFIPKIDASNICGTATASANAGTAANGSGDAKSKSTAATAAAAATVPLPAPLLTHIRYDQLFWVQNDLPIEWLIIDQHHTATPNQLMDANDLFYAAVPSKLLPPHLQPPNVATALPTNPQSNGATGATGTNGTNSAATATGTGSGADSHIPLPILLDRLRDGCDLPLPPSRLTLSSLARTPISAVPLDL